MNASTFLKSLVRADEAAWERGPRAAEQGPDACVTRAVGAHSPVLGMGDYVGHLGDIHLERLRPPARTLMLGPLLDSQPPLSTRRGKSHARTTSLSHESLCKAKCLYLDSAFPISKTREKPFTFHFFFKVSGNKKKKNQKENRKIPF